jgi:very-short-patch-repair endonuclease
MSADLPVKLIQKARLQAGIVTRQQAVAAGMAPGVIDAKLRFTRWRRIYRSVYATFTGPLPRRAQLWAAVLYAGDGAVLSHESAGEVLGLVDRPARVIHVTVPRSRRVVPVPGLLIHISDQPIRLPSYPDGMLPATLVEDTIIDLAEAALNVDDVYGWVTRAFGRREVHSDELTLLSAVRRRKRLRWRDELNEAIVAGAGGAHSALELRWDRDVEGAHGLPVSRKQLRFRKKDGTPGFRDRVYAEWGLIVELDGKQAHRPEQRGADRARDNHAHEAGNGTLRYGWKEVRHEPCETAVQFVKVLWRRGWRGRPKPCSARCPVGTLLGELDAWLAAGSADSRRWAAQEAGQRAGVRQPGVPGRRAGLRQ